MKLNWNYVLAAGIYTFAQTGILIGGELSEKNLSDGSPIQVEELTLNPIKGWHVDRARAGMSVVIDEPKSSEVIYDKPTYSRNLTVAKYAKGAVIDQEKLTAFKADLLKKFSTDSRLAQFSVNDAKLVDVRGKQDGILVYTSFEIGTIGMAQTHLLISGEKHQYHLSYTDLAERMTPQDPIYNQVWQTFMGVKISTPSPEKPNYAFLAAIIGLIVFGAASLILVIVKKSKKNFEDTTTTLFDDYDGRSDVALEVSTYGTAIHGWNIKG